ncbi:hypothetical protein SPHINGO391_470083 [Sphingomonas aurantiaca]|uniref:Uncharacterized protein n=1 Tax=Sphingomonas aurantiaca TaxID=185949 RepID=A0A5E7ZP32_9SPHN|nr:hypothetical protein SPHINGO391_470083 [Sphingomonas aurantiaca]
MHGDGLGVVVYGDVDWATERALDACRCAATTGEVVYD